MWRWFLSLFMRSTQQRTAPILVDREGVAYLPARRVILKAHP
jgi:hypothetical protein